MKILASSLLFSLCSIAALGKSVDQHFEDAKRLLVQGDHSDALQSLELAVSIDPSNYLSRFKRAAMLLSMGKNQAAKADFDRILEQKPDFDQALLQRAKINLKECLLSDAEKDLNAVLKNGGSQEQDAKVLLAESRETAVNLSAAKSASGSNNHDQVIELLTKVIATCTQDASTRMLRAKAYEAKGEIALAINDYTRASKLSTNDIETLLHTSELHLKLGEVDAAVSNLKQCLQYDPEHRKSLKLFKQLKKLTKAIAKSTASMEKKRHRDALDALDPEKSSKTGAFAILEEMNIAGEARHNILNDICECLGQLKSTDRVLKWCTLAIKEETGRPENYCYRAEAHIVKEDFDAAMRDFSKAGEDGQSAPNCAREGQQKVQKLQRQAGKKDYYKVLGVSRDASEREIKKAFRAQAMIYHPDKYDGDEEVAQKKMTEINQAYEVLGNPELKQRYDNGDDPNDQQGQGGGGGFNGNPFQNVVFQQGGGSPFGGFGGGGGGGGFKFHFG